MDNEVLGKLSIQVLDTRGRLIKTIEGNKNAHKWTEKVSTSSLQGVYILKINIDGVEVNKSIVVF
jgi:hypothetical protein